MRKLKMNPVIEKRINAIAKMTDRNCHTEAYIASCNLIGSPAKDIKTQFESILSEQDRLGYLPNNRVQVRYNLYQDMMKLAYQYLDRSEYRALYASL